MLNLDIPEENESRSLHLSDIRGIIVLGKACHKVWAEICEIRQIFKRDLIKFCEIFTKITLKLSQSSQKPLFIHKQLVIKTTKCDLCFISS